MTDLPTFDEVHVVSDLHMGGRAGAQVFRETRRLANYIERLATQRPDGTLALVLNGDVFDTLAEDIAGFIAIDEAVATIERIVRDPSFAPVWEALADFVRCFGRTLVFVIGNHDLEIALPDVQRLLQATLAGDDPAARGRIEFWTVGAGFACRVGHARVFCTHGNEVDGWNYNRYEDLATLARRLNAGLTMGADEWRPNAGTRMVKEVMNDIKRRYAWIDLLKPETSAAIGALLVLDPTQATRLGRIAGLIGQQRRGQADARTRLSSDEEDEARSADAMPPVPVSEVPEQRLLDQRLLDQRLLDQNAHGQTSLESNGRQSNGRQLNGFDPNWLDANLLGPNLRAILGDGADDEDDDLLAIAERHFSEPRSPAIARPAATLGVQQRWHDRLRGVTPAEALRRALLDWLPDERSFDAGAADDTSRRLCAAVGPAVDFLVAGHTHLERAIDRGHGRYYFNTGTWMRLLRLTPAMLADRVSFEPVWAVLRDGSLPAIDAARFGSEPFVLNRTSAVAIRSEEPGAGPGGACVVGELLHVEGDGRGEPRLVQRFVRR